MILLVSNMCALSPKQLFNELLNYYGSQNWWPGEGFEIAIGAILTQNTSWNNVEKALLNLKNNDILTPEQILQCEDFLLKELIRPAGFFNQKAIYLKNISRLWIADQNPSREELLSVKGIGEETADSILLYLLNEPHFVIDIYTVRICNRIGFGNSSDKTFWKNFFESSLERDVYLFNEYHALLVIHAKNFCKKKSPKCNDCFLRKKCAFGQRKTHSF